ncbi:alpha/beta fold hydrolase [Actinokineospora sp. HUAS TT18]|uniref:alpha/beta fold hydrolase n=1 Tax=Actinokineospora sp. HUAS TT18 TaxID=3447451 RepID=UPI003F522371
MRACAPESDGIVVRDGVKLHYARYGHGHPTILLLPTWSLVHSRCWKLQVPYLARHFTVVTFDGRGNGASDRPVGPAAYADTEFAADALAVLDAAGIDRAVLVGISAGGLWGLRLCAEHGDRVLGAVFIAPAVPLAPPLPERTVTRFHDLIDDPVGWQTYNVHFWRDHYREFVEFMVGRILTESHSTKQIEDAVGWALETDGELLADSHLGLAGHDEACARRLAAMVTCPMVILHGTDDAVRNHAASVALAEATGAELVTLVGAGHFPQVREPVRVNLIIKRFAERFGR